MVYTCKYKSSIGDILLATDEIGLIGLWFEGQKYFANTLPDEPFYCLCKNFRFRMSIFHRKRKFLQRQ